MTTSSVDIALAYLTACATKDSSTLERLLAPDVHFSGPGNAVTGRAPYLAILARLGTVWVRSDVKQVFHEGNEVCVIYDFVTDTEAGAVPLVEWLRVEGGQVTRVTLFFDRLSFKPAADEAARRASR